MSGTGRARTAKSTPSGTDENGVAGEATPGDGPVLRGIRDVITLFSVSIGTKERTTVN